MSDDPNPVGSDPPEGADPTLDLLGTVAIVGFPNVGKSTLINRLTATRAAVVHETSGTTRDRKELVCEWAGKRFLLIDTGGVDVAGRDTLTRSIAEQARKAVGEADLVLLVVDARAGVTPGDEELAEILRTAHTPVLVLANKIDDPSQESLALELHRLGLGDPFPLSAMHGHNTGDLLDEVVERLEETGEARPSVGDEAIRVAILGRPNVGKSSLFNALIGVERTIVSEVPGTTRDAIDTVLERDGRVFQLIDTAGLRRKRRQRQGIEYYSELRALEAAERADVALVLIDASEGIVEGRPRGGRHRPEGAVLDARRPLEMGPLAGDDRGRPPGAAAPPPPAAAVHHDLGQDGPRHLARARQGRRALRQARRADHDRRAEPLPRRAEGGAPAALAGQQAAQPPLRRPGHDAPAALPLHRQRHEPRHPRLRLLGRERAPRAVRDGGRAGDDRLPAADVRAVVVGGGTWGTGFSRLLVDRGFEVTLALRRADDAAAIRETGHNPRYLTSIDLTGVEAVTIAEAPVAAADLVVVALPSRAFRSVVAGPSRRLRRCSA